MKRYFFYVAALTASLLLSGCSRRSQEPSQEQQEQPTPEEELSKVIESIEAEVPDIGTEDIQPSIFPKQEELLTLPSTLPYPEDFSGTQTIVGTTNYFNFINHLPFLSTESGILTFEYNGGFYFTDSQTGTVFNYHIGDYMPVSYSQGKIDYNNWFYMGSMKTSNGVYVRYDYLGNSKVSFFFKMDFNGSNPIVCASTPYISQETFNVFTATENGIYFTYIIWNDDVAQTSIIFAEPDGSNPRAIYTFEPNDYVSYLIPTEQKLCFLVTSKEHTNLMELETQTRTLSTLVSDSKAEFLYIVDDYYILSADTQTLHLYNRNKNRLESITITSKSGYTFSIPFFDEGMVYTAIYSLEQTSPTQIVPIILKDRSAGKVIQLSDTFYYCLGIDNGVIYTESGNSYRFFDLATKEELSSPREKVQS